MLLIGRSKEANNYYAFLFNFQHWEFCHFKGPWNMNSTIIISIIISKDLTSPWRPKIVRPLQTTCSTELCNFLFLLKIPATWQTRLPETRDVSLHSGYTSLFRVLYYINKVMNNALLRSETATQHTPQLTFLGQICLYTF